MRTFVTRYIYIAVLLLTLLVSPAIAITAVIEPNPPLKKIENLKLRDLRQLYGRPLTFREKISWLVLKKQLKKKPSSPHGKVRDRAKTALILGILGLIFLFIPFLNLASIPLAILAIVKGNEAKHADPYDKRARTAVKLGIVTLSLLVVIGIAVAIVLTFGSIGPR